MNPIRKGELKLKDVKVRNIHHYNSHTSSHNFTFTQQPHLFPLLDLHTMNIMIRSKLHFLKHPCPLSLWSLASWTFLLSQNRCHTDHFAVGFCDLGADRFYGLCSAIRVKSLKGKMQTQHCDPHSKAMEFNCGRPSKTMNKMGHLDRIQITQNLKQKREVVFHRATERYGVGSEPHQSNQNSFLSDYSKIYLVWMS